MANIVYANAHDSSAMFGRPSAGVMNMMREGLAAAAQTATAYGATIIQQAQKDFVDVTTGKTARRLEALRNKFQMVFNPDTVSFTTDIGEIQQAKSQMQSVVMAMPQLRELYYQGRIAGYGDSYVDPEPESMGIHNTLYRSVVDGMFLMDEDEEGNNTLTIHQFVNLPTDEQLTFNQKTLALGTWQSIATMLETDDTDPTDPWNGVIDD